MFEGVEIVNKGEFVMVIDGAAPSVDTAFDTDSLLLELATCLSAKDASKVAARITGKKKNELYQRLLRLKKDPPGP
jgi:16S rRNA (cytidine1402-2'-O)-methyltransferase